LTSDWNNNDCPRLYARLSFHTQLFSPCRLELTCVWFEAGSPNRLLSNHANESISSQAIQDRITRNILSCMNFAFYRATEYLFVYQHCFTNPLPKNKVTTVWAHFQVDQTNGCSVNQRWTSGLSNDLRSAVPAISPDSPYNWVALRV
jgi:hypothetical protein